MYFPFYVCLPILQRDKIISKKIIDCRNFLLIIVFQLSSISATHCASSLLSSLHTHVAMEYHASSGRRKTSLRKVVKEDGIRLL